MLLLELQHFSQWNSSLQVLDLHLELSLIAGIVDDGLDEPNETVIVTLSNPSNATLGSDDAHTYTILIMMILQWLILLLFEWC